MDTSPPFTDQHRAQAEALTGRHVKARMVELADTVLARERVYLDMNFWLRLRDVILGRRKEPSLIAILDILRNSVKAGTRLCPISESTFLELMKQQDSRTRLATAQLIDELSEGVALVPVHERMATEVAHFLHASLGHDVLEREQLVWTKLSYNLGIVHPFLPHIDAQAQSALQVAFFDHMWNITLSEMLRSLDVDAAINAEMARIAALLNDLNKAHAATMRGFRRVYEDEFVGGLDLASEVGLQVIEQMGLENGSIREAPTDAEREQRRQQVFGLLRVAFEQKRDLIVRSLPTLHIGALCHAAVRWDQGRKVTGNDLMDFHHAQAALPYCQVLLTDGPMREIFQQGHIRMGESFSCRIFSTPGEAEQYLR